MEKMADIVETTEVEKIAFAPQEIMVTDDSTPIDLVIVDEPMAQSEEDYEKSQNLEHFMSWIAKKMHNLPQHSGKTTAGCERVIAHLKMLDKEISKAISRDVDCKLDDQAVEKFRKDIRKMIKQLEKRHKEINDAYDADDEKYASAAGQIVKTAEIYCKKCGFKANDRKAAQLHAQQKHPGEDVAFSDLQLKQSSTCACEITKSSEAENCPKCNIKLWKAAEGLYECISCDQVFEGAIKKEAHTARLTLIMTPFERAITGAIVNGFVSQGKNPEEIYAELNKKYKFSERDELSIHQILYDMGYPILKDRGHLGDASEQLNKGKGIEFSTQYNA